MGIIRVVINVSNLRTEIRIDILQKYGKFRTTSRSVFRSFSNIYDEGSCENS